MGGAALRFLRVRIQHFTRLKRFGDDQLNSWMVVKYAWIRRLQCFPIRRMDNDALPKGESNPNLHVSAVATGQQNDQHVCFRDAVKF